MCSNYGYAYSPCGYANNNGSNYALILVLFILLVIIGSAWANKAQ
jgi:uncharacterized protein (TIGR01732 family)